MNSDGAKTPPDPPMAIVRLVASDLPAEQERAGTTVTYWPRDRALEHRVADAVHLGQREQQQAQHETAGGGP